MFPKNTVKTVRNLCKATIRWLLPRQVEIVAYTSLEDEIQYIDNIKKFINVPQVRRRLEVLVGQTCFMLSKGLDTVGYNTWPRRVLHTCIVWIGVLLCFLRSFLIWIYRYLQRRQGCRVWTLEALPQDGLAAFLLLMHFVTCSDVFAPSSAFLLLVVMPGATSSFLLLVAMPFVPSSFLLLANYCLDPQALWHRLRKPIHP